MSSGQEIIPIASEPTRTLADLEGVIERGLATFAEVGLALLEIRDGRMYEQQGHGSFGDYLQVRWPGHRSRAYQLIAAVEVTRVLSTPVDSAAGADVSWALSTVVDNAPAVDWDHPPMVETLPNERQARELAPLRNDPETMRDAWTEVRERHGEKPTAAAVREVVREHRAPAVLPLQLAPATRESIDAHQRREAARISRENTTRAVTDALTTFNPKVWPPEARAADILSQLDPEPLDDGTDVTPALLRSCAAVLECMADTLAQQ